MLLNQQAAEQKELPETLRLALLCSDLLHLLTQGGESGSCSLVEPAAPQSWSPPVAEQPCGAGVGGAAQTSTGL